MKDFQSSSATSAAERQQSFPYGTVTFLFADIEGSTPLWEGMPDEMRAAVAQYRLILRQAIEANNGHEFQIFGDSFQAAFRLASDGLSTLPVRHRMPSVIRSTGQHA
jgi:class 3 adenylate cyclase